MTAAPPRASSGATVFGCIIVAAAGFLWIAQVATLSDLSHSDAAGNALSQAFGAIEIVILWVLLAILMIVAVVQGTVPWPAAITAAILVPASGYAALTAADLLAHPNVAPFLWPIIIPVAVPLAVVGFGFWALVPALRNAVPAALAGGLAWGAVLVLCVSLVPMLQWRQLVNEQEAAALAKYEADYARLPADAALWDLAPFLATANSAKQDAIVERISHLDQRQRQAEVMLERGDFPLGYLGRFDLEPTPSICEKARALLRLKVAPLVSAAPNSQPYVLVAEQVSNALAAMRWLVGYGCSCDAESHAWEDMANGYRDTSYDVVELRELRQPAALGRVLREHPAHFSMLTPQSHLKAWLHFADDKALHDRALAGARMVVGRNDDAVEMLNDRSDIAAPWLVLQNLAVLDLEATPALCSAGLTELRREFAPIYRPRPDDPRPYSELLSRLGGSEPLPALVWLAQHGCAADAELGDATALVERYQDSPEREAMLATLSQLRRKP